MQKIAIEVSYEDQLYVENVCTKTGLSYSKFFKLLLDGYKKLECQPCESTKVENVNTGEEKTLSVDTEQLEDEEQPKKRTGRPAKSK